MKRILIACFALGAMAIILPSCATTDPVRIDNPQELFPDHVPSNICYLRTVRAVRLFGFRSGYNSAGTLIEGKYLVTAAHNLYDSWRTKLISVQVSCKDENGTVVTSVVDRSGIEQTRNAGHYDRKFPTDYAFLKLNNPLAVKESVTLNPAARIDEIDTIEVAGYPGGKLKYGAGDVKKPILDDSTFYYSVDTAKGMSGGPVWAIHHGVGSLVGVHVSEGRARVVDSRLINDFENWKANID